MVTKIIKMLINKRVKCTLFSIPSDIYQLFEILILKTKDLTSCANWCPVILSRNIEIDMTMSKHG